MIFKSNDFNLKHTFDCGQCFRWNENADGSYTGIIYGNTVNIRETADGSFETDFDDYEILKDYFDLERDYGALKKAFSDDGNLKKASEYGYGIRILHQEPWETLVSFIISANNNIPRIKKIINSLCANFGEKITEGFYSFPKSEALAKLEVSDLDVIKSGFRAKYILDAAKKVHNGEVELEKVYDMPSDEGREYLKKVKGVGDKVADCTLLFAYRKYDVFPKDVWIKRILNNLYGLDEKEFDSGVKRLFGDFGGFAQQYLFYYEREK